MCSPHSRISKVGRVAHLDVVHAQRVTNLWIFSIFFCIRCTLPIVDIQYFEDYVDFAKHNWKSWKFVLPSLLIVLHSSLTLTDLAIHLEVAIELHLNNVSERGREQPRAFLSWGRHLFSPYTHFVCVFSSYSSIRKFCNRFPHICIILSGFYDWKLSCLPWTLSDIRVKRFESIACPMQVGHHRSSRNRALPEWRYHEPLKVNW